jgi:hypothetical protein
VGEQAECAACRLGADQDRCAVPVAVGDLGEGLVEDGDVIGGDAHCRRHVSSLDLATWLACFDGTLWK